MRWRAALLAALAAHAGYADPWATLADADTGRNAPDLVEAVVAHGAEARGWLRVRGVDLANPEKTRAALLRLKTEGARVCVMVRRPGDWRANYLPQDQREAFEQARRLGAAFGDLVDAWEIDNEPDLAFVPEMAENYAAYLKAVFLGLRSGGKWALQRAEGEAQRARATGSAMVDPSPLVLGPSPLVLFGALGLPPGPWFERFVENDGLSYTDGFNYHYYGYAQDFGAVYAQHENALKSARGKGKGVRVEKQLPVFLTEIGYGMLGGEAARTKEGRLRQWRWFKSVREQANALRIEAPMAFLLVPYLEYGRYEYGLTAAPAPDDSTGGNGGNGEEDARSRGPELIQHKVTKETKGRTAGGIRYVPEDFGVEKTEDWMQLIGTKVGENEMTPALAAWIGGRKGPGGKGEVPSRSWTVEVAEPSPVVIDFLPGEGLMPLKRFGGVFVTGNTPRKEQSGKGEAQPSAALPPMVKPPVPPKPPRSEDFIVQVRTQNGNLFEVYPVRTATPQWQTYLEHHDNFTMAFYGRAELPWRFRENKPLSLVLVLYPKEYPAVYEFRAPELAKLGTTKHTKNTNEAAGIRYRYGSGELVLYNFSEKPVSGRIRVPGFFAAEGAEFADALTDVSDVAALEPAGRKGGGSPDDSESGYAIRLEPMERKIIPIEVRVPGESFERFKAEVVFESDDVPPARFVTEFFPALEGMRRTAVAVFGKGEEVRGKGVAGSNAKRISGLKLASEEAPRRRLENGWFVQEGAEVNVTPEGIEVTVTGAPRGKPQRVEVEFPWPDGQPFPTHAFLSMQYRLAPTSGDAPASAAAAER